MEKTPINVQTFNLAKLPPRVMLFTKPADIIPAFERGDCMVGLINLREQIDRLRPDCSESLKADFYHQAKALVEQIPNAHEWTIEQSVVCPLPDPFFHRDGGAAAPEGTITLTGIFRPFNGTLLHYPSDGIPAPEWRENKGQDPVFNSSLDKAFEEGDYSSFRQVNLGYAVFFLATIIPHTTAVCDEIDGMAIADYANNTPGRAYDWYIKRPPNLPCTIG